MTPSTSESVPLAAFVAAARGEAPADLVLRNARIVNVLTGEIHDGTVGVKGDRILGFGDYRAALYDLPNVLGLAEMMNVPGFLLGDPGVASKVEDARRRGVPIDGHSPLLSGLDLNAYIGAGIRSDHECLSRAA